MNEDYFKVFCKDDEFDEEEEKDAKATKGSKKYDQKIAVKQGAKNSAAK
eukprot:CAMPEP_0170554830 /NCGR_PEP_ID=MMETSP0211-20121228/12697_1 /TAXON_ID=311385 /ORGANISM="Pseudokeronopsis sp., Strain OXSARD2" /LENGTH=48 /DNA_ID= /DNA_START= /DNA_END= /DNA_ORIENTATION=